MTIQMIYEINNTYMAIDGSEIEPVEDYRHKMLQNNKAGAFNNFKGFVK